MSFYSDFHGFVVILNLEICYCLGNPITNSNSINALYSPTLIFFPPLVSSLDHVPTMSSSKVAGDKREGGCEECCACEDCFACEECFACEASHEFLFWFAAFIWFVGAFACLYRGYTLILQAMVYGYVMCMIMDLYAYIYTSLVPCHLYVVV